MRKFFTVLVLLIPSLASSQTLGFAMEEGKKKVVIPVEVVNNLVIVPLILNGQIPLRFILDTGVRTTILTQKTYADILGLDYSRRYTISGPGGKKLVDALVTNNVTLEIPGIKGTGLAMLVLEDDYLELRNYMGVDVHGVLGYELFSRFTIEFDYERNKVTIWRPEFYKPKRRFQMLPIRIQDTKPYVNILLKQNPGDTISLKLLIDAGAGHGLILNPESNNAIEIPEKNISSIIGRGLGGVITGKIGRIDALCFGKYQLKDVIASYPDPNSYTDTLLFKNRVHRNGAIGGEILSRFRITFDYPREKIYFKKNSSFKSSFNCNMSGLQIKAKGAMLRDYEITHVRENSPTDIAGLKEGDAIITINGIAASTLDLNEIHGVLNSRVGKSVSIEVRRGNEQIRAKFRLTNPI